MPPLAVPVSGTLYRPDGTPVLTGRLTISPMAAVVNGFIVTPSPITIDVPSDGALSFTLAPSFGVPYQVTFDPMPADIITPLELKVGYFAHQWLVPLTTLHGSPDPQPVTIASL